MWGEDLSRGRELGFYLLSNLSLTYYHYDVQIVATVIN